MSKCCPDVAVEHFSLLKIEVDYRERSHVYSLYYHSQDGEMEKVTEFLHVPDDRLLHNTIREYFRKREERESWEPKLGID